MGMPPSKNLIHRSYDPVYFEPLFEAEERHFWFRARNRVISTLVGQIVSEFATGYTVLEVGCGTGNVLRVLEHACPEGMVVGMDLFIEGMRYARQRTSCALIQGDIHTLPFHRQFALIGLFDVVEHMPDDIRVLQDVGAMLAPGGVLLLTVPASPSLWSYFDEAAHHCRRYEFNELADKLNQTGYDIEYLTPYMMSIYPFVWLGRRLATVWPRRSGTETSQVHDLTVNELRIVPVLNRILTSILFHEARLLACRRKLPFGTSLLAVARKRPQP